MLKRFAVPAMLVLAACAAPETDPETDLGPMTYDAGGLMPCSAGTGAFDEVCGWRVLRDGAGGAEIWISNIAITDRPAYRVLDFKNGAFTARDGTALDVSKSGDMWTVRVPGREEYRFAGAILAGD
ncbi:MAG: hypothetical protein KDA73_14940 [Rhodobacteraceae bacterium]|nr:hypothetical protein [Paracoccaceae bacterium]